MNSHMIRTARLSGVALLAAVIVVASCSRQKETAEMNTATTIGQERPSGQNEIAIFAAGCFWGVEQTFRQAEGVLETSVGYTGGYTENPTYKQVCSGRTGHAEAVRIVYDPQQVSYEELLEVFWTSHDPTTPNRQGPDVGEQYRSAVFTTTDTQADKARESKQALDASGRLRRPVVTQIVPAQEFYQAEEYHQQYYEKTGGGTCHF